MIGRRLGVDFKNVRRYVRADSVEELIADGVRISKLDPFKPYLHQQLAAGVRNATRLFVEIAQLGYTGSYPVVERHVQPLRQADAAALARAVRTRPPPVRQVTAWITGLPGNLDCADHARLQATRGRCPEIDAAVGHVAGFVRMIKDLSGKEEKLTAWTAAVDHDLPALRHGHRRVAPQHRRRHRGLESAVQLRTCRGRSEQDQGRQDAAVRTSQPRPVRETGLAHLT